MSRLAAIADAITTLALVAWVGGHAALGAFAARVVFRELPREVAAPTMTAVFRSFDRLMLVALVVVALATVARLWAVRLAGWPALVALGGLCAVGAFELTYVHPSIETLFREGRTLEPAFLALHKLSERCAHLEVALTALYVAAQAWSRAKG